MAMTCDDVNARLLDLIYDEGDAAERRALQAHVDGCARCRADLAALGGTRAMVRATLDDEPPPGARARIMEAAAQALAGARAGAGAAAAAATARGAGPVTGGRGGGPSTSSFWGWLRGRWTLPTFATVGAVALMLVASKVILNPALLPAPVSGLAARPSATASAPVPALAPPPPAAELDRLERAKSDAERAHYRAAEAASASAPARRAAHMRRAEAEKDLARGAPAAPEGAGAIDDVIGGSAGVATSSAAPRAMKKSAKREMADEPADGLAGLAGGGASQPQPPPAAAAEREEAPGTLGGRSRDKAAGSPVFDRVPAASAPAAAPPPVPAAAPAPAARPASAPVSSMDELARRADRLFADHRWDAAVAAYQELVRRYPTADGAARWRARVVEARRARAASAPAPAAVDRL